MKMHALGIPLIGERTMRKYIGRMGFKYKKPSKLSKLNRLLKQERLNWCLTYQNYNWKNFIFLDETTVWSRSLPYKGWFKNDSTWPLY